MRSTRHLATVGLLGATTALAGSAVAAADLQAVAPGQQVLGSTQGQWAAADWRRYLEAPTSFSPDESCATRQHGQMWFLQGLGDINQPGNHYHHQCTVPAGTYLFVSGTSQECSNLEKGNYHASTGARARRCARREWRRHPGIQSITLDGQPISSRAPIATPVFTFKLPRHNISTPSATPDAVPPTGPT
jgi:hypothetical protein